MAPVARTRASFVPQSAEIDSSTSTKSRQHTHEMQGSRLGGLVSIVISWLQVLSALTVTYQMAWPIAFATYSKGTGSFVKLEIMSLHAVGSCQLALPFLNKFLLQILVPPIFVAAVVTAFWTVRCCLDCIHGHKPAVQRARSELASQLVVVILQLARTLAYCSRTTFAFAATRASTLPFPCSQPPARLSTWRAHRWVHCSCCSATVVGCTLRR